MDREKIHLRIGLLLASLLVYGLGTVIVDRVLHHHYTFLQIVTEDVVIFDSICLVLVLALTFWKHRFAHFGLGWVVFLSSGMVILTNPSASYFGLATAVLGTLLLIRLGLLDRHPLWKSLGIALWTVSFVIIADQGIAHVPLGDSIKTLVFLGVNIAILYILFEEEIRGLLAANKTKDDLVAEQAAEIARLVPLSALGERIAHVTHSFKNNLGMLNTVRLLVAQGESQERILNKLDQYSASMTDRIDNILMVSRAGVDQTPEVFDAARVLWGLNQVYLSEPAFLARARVELVADQATPLLAVRWDFILLIENILKNALEALSAREAPGTIRITLRDRQLTLANDGGAMALCTECRDSCLACPRYGKPGRTTKAEGSGHGLAQVFATCRNHGWTLRIRTEDGWTVFEIGLSHPPLSGRKL